MNNINAEALNSGGYVTQTTQQQSAPGTQNSPSQAPGPRSMDDDRVIFPAHPSGADNRLHYHNELVLGEAAKTILHNQEVLSSRQEVLLDRIAEKSAKLEKSAAKSEEYAKSALITAAVGLAVGATAAGVGFAARNKAREAERLAEIARR